MSGSELGFTHEIPVELREFGALSLRRPRARIDLPYPLQDHSPEMDAMDLGPIPLERARLERDGASTCDARRRGDQRSQAVVHGSPERRVDALQQVPEREGVLGPRECENI